MPFRYYLAASRTKVGAGFCPQKSVWQPLTAKPNALLTHLYASASQTASLQEQGLSAPRGDPICLLATWSCVFIHGVKPHRSTLRAYGAQPFYVTYILIFIGLMLGTGHAKVRKQIYVRKRKRLQISHRRFRFRYTKSVFLLFASFPLDSIFYAVLSNVLSNTRTGTHLMLYSQSVWRSYLVQSSTGLRTVHVS